MREDRTVELMALVAGAVTAIGHASAETNPDRSSHIAQVILRAATAASAKLPKATCDIDHSTLGYCKRRGTRGVVLIHRQDRSVCLRPAPGQHTSGCREMLRVAPEDALGPPDDPVVS